MLSPQMEPRKSSPLTKVFIIAAVGVALGLGLCGTGIAVQVKPFSGAFLIAGAFSFWGGALLLIVAVVWAVIAAVFGGNRR